MDTSTLKAHPKKLSLFLNTSFLFLLSLFIFTNVLHQPRFGSTAISLFPSAPPLHQVIGYESKCAYVKSQNYFHSKRYINYLEIFYCTCGKFPGLGYSILLLWLVVLFYLLGNTASEYFCPSLESLSKILNLSPTIAGTTLLPLGNGVTDVFSSIISFTQSNDGGVGINSVLGGAFFISCVVVGIISILITKYKISVDKSSFVRDVLFLLLALSSLSLVFIVGEISLWGSICFVSIYFVYIVVVSVMHFYRQKDRVVNLSNLSTNPKSFLGEFGEVGVPLLGCVDEEKLVSLEKGDFEPTNQIEISRCFTFVSKTGENLLWFLYLLELPLYLPRRLTIPCVRVERWSKPFAVISVILAPILLAALWNTQNPNLSSKTSSLIYMTSGLIGLTFGVIASVATKKSIPPKKYLFPWVFGGFLMSIIWTYITAKELVSLLESIGSILGISPSILGLTVLAWGNSTGDLIANGAVAMNGGSDGVQIAVSGCYAGPLFNTLVGLGLSLVFASWSEYPSSYVIPNDPFLFEILGFLIAGLLWALVILPKKSMRVDRSLGGGLLAIYCCFLCLRFSGALGVLKQLDEFYVFKTL
ncbi:hypothetical protein RHMOL_Rhmol03G0054400 [Rhododendron molle]|uniref:Uncharacterized protein n=1 Tax=Rhododendron molle TaxID=49168 RepID=A0ACC0PAV6_RHOML|nr:hypothetical protein RHMOL_Rhmol03G0054400 [Rhododendron molle]